VGELGGHGLLCRQHLLEGESPPGDVYDELARLVARLGLLIGSMTVRRTPVGPREKAAWVEALEWFGGWDYARKLAQEEDG
jgi:hypothetical protein